MILAPKEKASMRHGGPYDRGSADAYYGRGRDPHFYHGASYQSERVEAPQMTEQEVAEYNAGFDGETNRKDWGE